MQKVNLTVLLSTVLSPLKTGSWCSPGTIHALRENSCRKCTSVNSFAATVLRESM